MRVTNLSSMNSHLRMLNETQSKLADIQKDISTGTKLHNPSDDPAATGRVINYTKHISKNETYLKNITNAASYMEHGQLIMEDIHDRVTDALTELASTSNTDTKENYGIAAEKIDALFDNILQLANTKHDEKYLFSGTDFSQPPFAYDKGTNQVVQNASDISGELRVKISSTTNQKVNVPGSEIFGSIDGTDVFNTLLQIKDNLKNGIAPTNDQVKSLESFNENMRIKTAESGSLLNHIYATEEMITNQNVKLQELMGADTDTDMAKSIMEMQSYDYSLQMAYKITSMTLSKSLMDYL